MNILIVGMGGAIGSIMRYGLNSWLASKALSFPIATFLANIMSCLILGIAVKLFSKELIDEHQRLFLITGVCGGFSTFSTFTNENFQLFQAGNSLMAILNIALNLVICIFFLILGFKII
jgi:fluoride exporter